MDISEVKQIDNEALKQLMRVKDKINFFKGLTDYQIEILLDDIKFKRFNKRDVIFRQDSNDDNFVYYILDGSVKINLKDEFGITNTITTLHRGSIIGEMQQILNQKRTAGCVAAQDDTIVIGFTINPYKSGKNGNIYAIYYKNLATILAKKLESINNKVK